MDFIGQLEGDLAGIRAQGLYRRLRRGDAPQAPHWICEGRAVINFSSNDYLGLANHPALKAAAIEATEAFGAGAGASRLISGSLAPYHELETALAEFKAVPAALSFSTGYAAALGTIGALLGKADVLIVDKLVHACIVDAARLCGARLRVFAHNDPADLARKLAWAEGLRAAAPDTRILVAVESVYSMDGDQAPLRELVELKDRHGAWLMVDEAHATGLYGAERRGLVEALGLTGRVEIQMGTLGKALGAAGGFICGPAPLADLLINRARSFIFSTAPVPAAAAAATAGIAVVRSAEGVQRLAQLWDRVRQMREGLRAQGWRVAETLSPIIPLHAGDEARALKMAEGLAAQAIYVPAIRYPTVARGQARLRVSLSAAHSADDVDALLQALKPLPP
jgi:8-amino-7-oxononanoate synthase